MHRHHRSSIDHISFRICIEPSHRVPPSDASGDTRLYLHGGSDVEHSRLFGCRDDNGVQQEKEASNKKIEDMIRYIF